MSWKDNGESHTQRKLHRTKKDCGDNTKCQAVTDECNKKFLACLFMHGVNGKSHENCVNELNNMHLSGGDWHPKSAEAAMTHMSLHMDENRVDEAGEGIQLMQNKTIKCWPHQEEGQKMNECPNHEKK